MTNKEMRNWFGLQNQIQTDHPLIKIIRLVIVV
jgi:hypothetical protein